MWLVGFTLLQVKVKKKTLIIIFNKNSIRSSTLKIGETVLLFCNFCIESSKQAFHMLGCVLPQHCIKIHKNVDLK